MNWKQIFNIRYELWGGVSIGLLFVALGEWRAAVSGFGIMVLIVLILRTCTAFLWLETTEGDSDGAHTEG